MMDIGDYLTNFKPDELTESFEDMGLSKNLLRSIQQVGLNRLSVIQKNIITSIISGNDTNVKGLKGSLKAVTYSIGILEVIDTSLRQCQALILAPTRELAQQITRVLSQIGDCMKIKCHACIGGTVLREDIRILAQGVHVVVGTPGRVLDMVKRKHLSRDYLKVSILDEANQLLSESFENQTQEIFQYLLRSIQRCCFFSMFNPLIMKQIQEFMIDPVTIVAQNYEPALEEGTKQYSITIENREAKFDKLCDLLQDCIEITKVVIYCNTRKGADDLAEQLQYRKFAVLYMHGGIELNKRELIVNEFINSSYKVLIMSDLSKLGVERPYSHLVINYDLPMNYKTYQRRILGSGCFGSQRVAINFISESTIKPSKNTYNISCEELPSNLLEVLN